MISYLLVGCKIRFALPVNLIVAVPLEMGSAPRVVVNVYQYCDSIDTCTVVNQNPNCDLGTTSASL
jgi:hypothetical protein